MSQQDLVKNFSNDLTLKFHRILFQETGYGFRAIASSNGTYKDKDNVSHALFTRIVEEYVPPVPSITGAEFKTLSSTSRLQVFGKSSRKLQLRLVFRKKTDYVDFIFHLDRELKYYDETGAIYLCMINGTPEVKRVEAGRTYDVKLELIAVRKDSVDEDFKVFFTDIEGNEHKEFIADLAQAGLITILDRSGNYVYTYRPNAPVLRSEIAVALNHLRKHMDKLLRS